MSDAPTLPLGFLAWPRKDRRAWLHAHPEATAEYVRCRINALTPHELASLRAAALLVRDTIPEPT